MCECHKINILRLLFSWKYFFLIRRHHLLATDCRFKNWIYSVCVLRHNAFVICGFFFSHLFVPTAFLQSPQKLYTHINNGNSISLFQLRFWQLFCSKNSYVLLVLSIIVKFTVSGIYLYSKCCLFFFFLIIQFFNSFVKCDHWWFLVSIFIYIYKYFVSLLLFNVSSFNSRKTFFVCQNEMFNEPKNIHLRWSFFLLLLLVVSWFDWCLLCPFNKKNRLLFAGCLICIYLMISVLACSEQEMYWPNVKCNNIFSG